MKRTVVAASILATLLLPPWCLSAVADPIQITSGWFEVTGSRGTVSVVGTRGFTLSSNVSTFDGVFRPWERCHFFAACVPGAMIDLEGYFVGLGLRGPVTLDGRTFPNVGGIISPNQASVRFLGSVLAPPLDRDTATVVAPFRLDGRFSYLSSEEMLTGNGFATLSLRRSFGAAEGLPSAWDYSIVRYDFTPAPEPATILLTAAGLLALTRRHFRRKSRGPR